MYFNWIGRERNLSNGALTVLAQTVSLNDDGRLLWDAFFPRRNVDSVKLEAIFGAVDFRPAADRREWNARGRLIAPKIPDAQNLEMIPIESYFKLGEREIQALEERTMGNEALFRQIVGTSIPERTDGLASANYRRIEVDAFKAWALGQFQTTNPDTGKKYTVSLPYDPARYETAAKAWNDPDVNAYDLFIQAMERAIDLVGPIQGIMTRTAVMQAIQADTPRYDNRSQIRPTITEVEERISSDLGSPFKFYRNEGTVDTFNGAGMGTTRTKLWAPGRLAVVPQGTTVGYTAFAPVARAMEIARTERDAGVDIRGMTAYTETANNGRELTVEVQVNALPLPEERLTFVVDTLVPSA